MTVESGLNFVAHAQRTKLTGQEWRYAPFVSLRIAALGLLAQHPGSGYDLLKRFEKSMANVWRATQSQLYGELNRLAEASLIEVTDVGPRGRKEYRVTAAGRAELQRCVMNPQNDPPFRSPGLLRIFLLGELSQVQAREHVVAVAECAESEVQRLEKLRDSIDWGDDDAAFFGRAALECGLRKNAVEAEWACWLVEAIDQRIRKHHT